MLSGQLIMTRHGTIRASQFTHFEVFHARSACWWHFKIISIQESSQSIKLNPLPQVAHNKSTRRRSFVRGLATTCRIPLAIPMTGRR
jgi:hypothetical protein